MHALQQTAPRPPNWNPSEESLQELVFQMVRQLVDTPAQVAVSVIEGQHIVILQVRVAPNDLGQVIGKKGRIAGALRTILTAAAGKQGKRALLEIIEEPARGEERTVTNRWGESGETSQTVAEPG